MNADEFGSRPPLTHVPLVIEAESVPSHIEPRTSILLASLQDGTDGSISRIGRVDGGVIVVTARQIDVFAEEAKSYREAGLIPPPPIKRNK